MRNKVGRPPKENREEIIKFQRVSMHIQTYIKLKNYSIDAGKPIVEILDDIINKKIV